MANRKKILIIGATGGSADVADILLDLNNEFDILGFLDDNISLHGSFIYGLKVLGSLDLLEKYDSDVCLISGIGSERNFKNKPKIFKSFGKNKKFPQIIHPTAVVSKNAQLGKGVIIYPNVVISAGSQIGDYVQILPNTIISHHSIIGNYSIVNANCVIAGWVNIQENCYIGSSTVIRQNVIIGSKSLVGMSSLILNNISDNSIAYGQPALVRGDH